MIHTMLPAQYAKDARLAEPHRRLMAAVLHAVIDDCRGGSAYRRSTGKGVVGAGSVGKAVAYVASTNRTWPYSFENLCDALDLDARELRRALLRAPGVATVRPDRAPHNRTEPPPPEPRTSPAEEPSEPQQSTDDRPAA